MKNRGYVFVYGTLKKGGYYSESFDERRVSSVPAVVKGTLYDLRSFPGLVLGGNSAVHGELHRYRDIVAVIRHMDGIEGHRGRGRKSNLYDKNVVEVETQDGKKVKAIVYTLNTQRVSTSGCDEVKNGTWELL